MNIEITKKELDRLLEVSYAVCKTAERPSITGINVSKNGFTGINGFQISNRYSEEIKNLPEVIIPMNLIRAVKALKVPQHAIVNIVINAGANHSLIEFFINGIRITGKGIPGNILNYKLLIREYCAVRTKVFAKELINAIKPFEKSDIVDLTVFSESIKLETETHEFGVNTFETKGIGKEPFKISCNPKKLKEALLTYKDSVFIEFSSKFQPILIYSEPDKRNFDLVMPMRKGPSCQE